MWFLEQRNLSLYHFLWQFCEMSSIMLRWALALSVLPINSSIVRFCLVKLKKMFESINLAFALLVKLCFQAWIGKIVAPCGCWRGHPLTIVFTKRQAPVFQPQGAVKSPLWLSAPQWGEEDATTQTLENLLEFREARIKMLGEMVGHL